ncbi:ubiquitin-conjugating enzyme E2 J2 [Stomoxys calcitrans]|uniref:Ubiquitin-conjugating enzyme E2 J2 n=1 Tax=Stomoxys calcitrans TaxID=35570 RepID=A0A1I8PLT0_STOCA|nr:ubiquitin-conjugating enzyme E2 J2 [Stomoxys calcitrans]XP_013110544.1 ubiquitin-conjugating enzyme E2 J2 [Stomoxys calcitrans]
MEVKKMSSSSSSSSGRKQPTAVSRMKQDYMRLKRDPLPYITAEPLPNNILEWHYVVKGPEDSPYYGGYYHGTLLFPREFPFKPPSIYMLTPNGRFKTNSRLCLSISDFHPDTWNPTWCVGTILTGLLSFMLENTATLGSIETTKYEKQQLAKKSLAFNLKNPHFVELFPDICEEINKRLQSEKEQKLKALNAASAAANGSVTQGASGKSTLANGNLPNGSIGANGIAINASDVVAGAAVVDANSGKSLSNSYLNWQSNVIILICFAIFALVVNYVLKNINQE